MVREVEDLDAELHPVRSREREVLEERDVPLLIARVAQVVARGVPEPVGAGRNLRERGRVEDEVVVGTHATRAPGRELPVRPRLRIANQVDGFYAEIPPAPSGLQKPAAYTGPALLGAEDTVPQTVEVRPSAGGSALGIPAVTETGEIRALEEIEADMIRLALGRYRGHMTEVAKRLKIGRSTLYRKMQEYGLEPRVN